MSTAADSAANGAGGSDLTKAQGALKTAVGLLQRKASIASKFSQVHQLDTRKMKQALAQSLRAVAELKQFREDLKDEEEQKRQSLEDEL